MTDHISKLKAGYLKQLESARQQRAKVMDEMRFLDKRIEQLTGAVYALEKALETPNQENEDGKTPESQEDAS